MSLGKEIMDGFTLDLQKEVARKIVRTIEKWRTGGRIKIGQKRWLFELIQNALDVARRANNKKLKIELYLKNSSFQFKHNGGYFTPEEIRALIFATSTKPFERTSDYAGKYATGFLVSHIVNQKVTIEGFLKKNNESYKFKTIIDRKSNDLEEVKRNFYISFEHLNKAKKIKNNKLSDSWTIFTYNIEDELGKKAVELGLEEFKKCLPFIFAFNNIECISINDNNYYKDEDYQNGIEIINVDPIELWKKSNGTSEIAVLINYNTNEIQNLNDTPRIYIKGLPIFETGRFIKIPFVINSNILETSEERETINFSEDNEESVNDVISECFDLYYDLMINIIENEPKYNSIENLVDIEKIKEESKIENNRVWEFFNKEIIRIISKIVNCVPIVETFSKKLPICEIKFPNNIFKHRILEPSIFKKFYRLIKKLNYNLPIEKNLNTWIEIAKKLKNEFNDELDISLLGLDELKDQFVNFVSEKGGSSFDEFSRNFSLKNSKQFLISFYQIIDDLFTIELVDGKYIDYLIPDQNGRITDYNWDDYNLFLDDKIPEDFKDIISEIGWKIRAELVDNDFTKFNITKEFIRTSSNVQEIIRKLIQDDQYLMNSEWDLMNVEDNEWFENSIGWVKLFNWCVYNKNLCRDFPIITKNERIIKIDDLNQSSIFIPFELMQTNEVYIESLKEFEGIYPDKRIINFKYFELENDNLREFIYKLNEYEFFLIKIPVYSDQVNLSRDKLISLLKIDPIYTSDIAEEFSIKHEVQDDNCRISVIPFWNEIIGRISKDQEKAILFFNFIMSYVIVEDSSWEDEITISCSCKYKSHKIIPSQYLAHLKIDSWVPMLIEEDEKDIIVSREANKETLENLVGANKINDLLKVKVKKVVKFLSHFKFDALDLQIKLRSIQEGLSEEEIRKIYSEYFSKYTIEELKEIISGNFSEGDSQIMMILKEKNLLPQLEELIAEDPDAFEKEIIKFKEKIEIAKKISEIKNVNFKVGKNVERIIKKILTDIGILVKVIHTGGDLAIWPMENEGWDIGLYKIPPYIMEVKFTSSNRARFSKDQANRAKIEEDNYVLTVVENGDNLRDRLNFDFNDKFPEDLIISIIENSNIIEKISTKLGNPPNPDEIEADIKGYWVKKKLWSNRLDLSKWINKTFSND